jgi:hypothetical protein
LAVSLLACTHEPRVEVARPATVSASPPSSAAAPKPSARPTRCAARPSTVYGEEPVVFHVEAEAESGAALDYELRDERGRSITKGVMQVPGPLEPPALPSGDFVLIVGDNLLRCTVTVNRELVRATQTTR